MTRETTAPLPGRRIVVVGSTGSGKTTLAARLAALYGVPHIELDALHWGPGWTPAPDDQLRARVREAVSAGAWALDGNYSRVQDITWRHADTVVWLDYPFPLIMWRLTRRSLGRVLRQELLWGTNRESFRGLVLSRESLFLWAIKTFRRRRRTYAAMFRDPAWGHLIRIRLPSPAATEAWLARVGQARAPARQPASPDD